MFKDFYLILGVDRESSPSQIKQAYRRVAKQLHPDTTACGASSDRFLEAREAYETLADAERRRCYDAQLAVQDPPPRITRATARPRFYRPPVRHSRPQWNGLEPLREGIFHPGMTARFLGQPPLNDVCLEVVLSPREWREGGLFPIALPVQEPCPHCRIRGLSPHLDCPGCGGTGSRVVERELALGIPPRTGHGAAVTLHLDEVGLRGVRLHVQLRVDPMLTE
ncbi:MAG: DnaJ domain-containing protein [Desulfobacterales bacterium]